MNRHQTNDITQAVLDRLAADTEPRFREIITGVVRHAHAPPATLHRHRASSRRPLDDGALAGQLRRRACPRRHGAPLPGDHDAVVRSGASPWAPKPMR